MPINIKPLAAFARRHAPRLTDESAHPLSTFLVQALVILAVFARMDDFVPRYFKLDEKDYFHPFLAARLLSQTKPLLILAAWGVFFFLFRRRLRWSELDPSGGLRIFVFVAAATIGWAFSCYPYNYYHDHYHAADRVLLAALTLLVLFHPGYVPYFIAAAVMILGQFDLPFIKFSWTDKAIILDILSLFTLFMMFRAVFRRGTPRLFLFLALCMTAADYAHSGFAKLRMDWLTHEDLSHLFVAAYDNGWLGFLGEEGMLQLRGVFHALNWPLMLGTLALEAGALFALFNRRVAAAFLAGWIMMHIGIFAASGILFWKWMALDAAFLYLIWLNRKEPSPPARERWAVFGFSVALIAGAKLYMDPTELGWYDTPVSPVFRFEAPAADGTVREIPPSRFAPFDFIFAQGRFYFLTGEEALVTTFGATNKRETSRALAKARSAEEVAGMIRVRSSSGKEVKKAAAFDRFIEGFVGRLSRDAGAWRPADWLAAPQHIWTGPVGFPALAPGEAIRSVRVRFILTFFDGERRSMVKEELVREIEMPGWGGLAAPGIQGNPPGASGEE